jgi:hypothetical protein
MLRREPYRLLFPIGIALAAAGVVPWLLFARGVVHEWPGLRHALVMSQGFYVAVALGFLGTMLPRRTATPPLGAPALAALTLGVLVASAAFLGGAVVVGELAYLVTFAGLAVAAARRLRRAAALPPSFVMAPVGAAHAVAGAALLVAGAVGGPGWATILGRGLVAQGFMLALVLAIAPMLAPMLLRGGAARAGSRGFHAVVAVLLATSFPLELAAPRAGLLLRAGVVAAALVTGGVFARGSLPGLHRATFRLALMLIPLGLLAAGLVPERRVALLHITYGGGFALLILAVTIHVTLVHAGLGARPATPGEAGRRPLTDRWPVVAVASVMAALAAVGLRASLETFGAGYVAALSAAATLWLAAVALWGGFLAPHFTRST